MDDRFLLNYNAADLRIASEFLSTWLPFLSRDLCHRCTSTLSRRIQSLDSGVSVDDGDVERTKQERNTPVLVPNGEDRSECSGHPENWDTNSLGSWKDAKERNDTTDTNSIGSWKDSGEVNDTGDTNSIGSWKDGASGWSEPDLESSGSRPVSVSNESPRVRMSWADMAQEDELGEEEEEQREPIRQSVNGYGAVEVPAKQELSRDQREYFRFTKVLRKKDFICLERVNGKITNVLEGLELHSGVFSAAEQKRIVDFVYELQESGKKGELQERTYTAPQKWMRGKGRVTIQFGCCYNYATDKNGNPPGILPRASVDPIPPLFKVIIRRLVRWHVLPPSCVPDSCIVNIYDEGDCIPPHIDNHDFVRPFCTVSFLSECDILFGTNLKIVGAGEFSGSTAIPLPVGSVLVLNGNGADVAKHCVPAVPTKRISITFRKMDESKRPIGFVPEPDLQGLEPLSYETETPRRHGPSRPKPYQNRQPDRRGGGRGGYKAQGSSGRGTNSDPRNSIQVQLGPSNRRTVRINPDR